MDYGFHSEKYVSDLEDESESNLTNVALTNDVKTLTPDFEQLAFDNNYNGPGFIGTWYEVNNSTVNVAPFEWEINYKDEIFYITGELPDDPGAMIMTAEYKDGKLSSHNGTQCRLVDYENPNTLEIELPDTIEAGNERSQFYFEDGYLQFDSEIYGDLRNIEGIDGLFEGYDKQ